MYGLFPAASETGRMTVKVMVMSDLKSYAPCPAIFIISLIALLTEV